MMSIEEKELILLDKAKEMDIPFRIMTDEEKARISHITRNSYFKKKYRMALEVTTKMMIQEMYKEYPDRPLNDVLSAAMKEYKEREKNKIPFSHRERGAKKVISD